MGLIKDSKLGQSTQYDNQYDPKLLFAISRQPSRKVLGVDAKPDFFGFDTWHAFELSWLNSKGKPVVAVADFIFPCSSPSIIESKSFKLYLNSFNGTSFESEKSVVQTLEKDLAKTCGSDVEVNLQSLNEKKQERFDVLSGFCLDGQDVSCSQYKPDPSLICVEEKSVKETLFSHLLKSNCPVTGQPDWASVEIIYEGPKINRAGLLKYIVSFRNHMDFHEQCVERIFVDIKTRCKPSKLAIGAYYTRRGGLDINPFRSTHKSSCHKKRLFRQ